MLVIESDTIRPKLTREDSRERKTIGTIESDTIMVIEPCGTV